MLHQHYHHTSPKKPQSLTKFDHKFQTKHVRNQIYTISIYRDGDRIEKLYIKENTYSHTSYNPRETCPGC